MPKMTMLVGVPASGKSTWVEENREKYTFVYSPDTLIEFFAKTFGSTYTEAFSELVKPSHDMMDHFLEIATSNSFDIIWDQTNLTKASRAKKLAKIPDTYVKEAIVFVTPEKEELERRLASRPDKTIPSHVIVSMIKSYECPQLTEGFTSVYLAETKSYNFEEVMKELGETQ